MPVAAGISALPAAGQAGLWGAGTMGGAAGMAGGGGMLASLGAFASAHPILAAILAAQGLDVVQNLAGGLFGGPSPMEQAAAQQMGIGKQLIPQLQAQAVGQPTLATQAQGLQLRQMTTRAQQAYGGSALSRRVGQTTPSAVQQQRFRQAETGAMGNIMAQSQLAAQQQLQGLYTGGLGMQQQMEAQAAQSRQQFMSGLAGFMAMYQQDKSDPEMQEILESIKRLAGLQERLVSQGVT